MISLSYKVRISRQKGYKRRRRLFDTLAQPTPPTGQNECASTGGEFGSQSPLLGPVPCPDKDDPASTMVEYDLSLEKLNHRVLTPFEQRANITLSGHTISFDAIERIEIRAKKTDTTASAGFSRFLDRRLSFDWNGTDVTKEFINDPPPWGPSIGAADRPEMIHVDLLFDRLVTNDSLRKATRTRFRSRNFTDAVEAAFKCLDNAVKEKTGLSDKSGSDLMFTVLNENNPVLQFNELRSTTDRDEQRGYKHLFAGAMTGIRNPRAHEPHLHDDPKTALELLTLANHLMGKVETSREIRATKKP